MGKFLGNVTYNAMSERFPAEISERIAGRSPEESLGKFEKNIKRNPYEISGRVPGGIRVGMPK